MAYRRVIGQPFTCEFKMGRNGIYMGDFCNIKIELLEQYFRSCLVDMAGACLGYDGDLSPWR